MITREFDQLRGAFTSSVPGRLIVRLQRTITSAWRTSLAGSAARSIAGRYRAAPAPAVIRAMAVAVAIAALLQPLLVSLMPRTVAPAMPWAAFALVVFFAGAVAWQSETIAAAWPASRLARWMRR